MRHIEFLMRELNLTDEIIDSTVQKINTICSNNFTTECYKSGRKMALAGNGNGNGNGNGSY